MRLAWHSAIDTASPATISVSTADIIRLPLIAFEAGSGWFQQAGLQVTPVMQPGSIEAIKRMVAAGLGYSIIPRMAVARRYDSEGIAEIIRLLQQHEWNTPL